MTAQAIVVEMTRCVTFKLLFTSMVWGADQDNTSVVCECSVADKGPTGAVKGSVVLTT